MIRLKPAASGEEFKTIARLADTIWREHYIPIIGKPQVDYMLSRFQTAEAMAEQARDGMRYYVISYFGKPAGYFAFEHLGDELFLSKIYVLKSHRGKGLARTAMEEIHRQAEDWGCRQIALTVNKHNKASIAAYQRLGFQLGKGTIKDIGDGFIMDDYRMTLEL